MRLIDAEELYHRMYEEAFEKDSDLQKWDSGCWIRFKLFENVLKDMPEVEEKTGHWKYTTHYTRPYRICSVCGCEREDDHSTGWNYCPNCGGKMKRKENKE